MEPVCGVRRVCFAPHTVCALALGEAAMFAPLLRAAREGDCRSVDARLVTECLFARETSI